MNAPIKDKVYGIEKASILKRFSSFLLDAIVIIILTTGFALLLSWITNYTSYIDTMNEKYAEYGAMFDVDLTITEAEYNELSDEKKADFEKAMNALNEDDIALEAYAMVSNLTTLIVTFGILLAYVLAEFVVPLILKNGQTIGKKVFGLCVIKNNCVKISHVALFVRTILGKFAIETMIPVYIILMIFLNALGILGTILVGMILVIQIVLLFATKNHTLVHDLMAYTVVVDKNTQMIFETEEALIEFKKRLNKEQVEANKKY